MRRTIEHAGWQYTVSPDAPLSAGAMASAIIHARLVDELTGLPVRGRVSMRTEMAGLAPRTAGDGLVGLAAIPSHPFTLLNLFPYPIPYEVVAEGYVPIARVHTMAAQPSFPTTFAGFDLGQIDLHREPVVFCGRVTAVAGLTATPVVGASVRFTGIWRTLPPATVATPPSPPNLLSLRPRVYFDRSAAVGTLRRIDMVPVAGDSRTLLVDTSSDTIRVSNRNGVVPGTVLRIDTDPERVEFMTVVTSTGGVTPDLPATITLTYQLRQTHRAGALVQRVTPGAPGPGNNLQADTIRGDSCVLLATMNGLAGAATIEIAGGPEPPEYHRAEAFEALTDAAGYYRLPPLSRVAQADFAIDDGIHTPITQTVVPSYAAFEEVVDFSFT